MDWRKRIGTVLGFGPPLVILAVSAAARGRYRKGAGAFFFENGWPALNTGLPYPVPLEEIERVELRHGSRELGHKPS